MSCDLKNVGCGLGRSKTSCCLHEEQLRQRLGGWEKGDIWESGRGRKKEDPIGVKTRVSESSQQLRPQMASPLRSADTPWPYSTQSPRRPGRQVGQGVPSIHWIPLESPMAAALNLHHQPPPARPDSASSGSAWTLQRRPESAYSRLPCPRHFKATAPTLASLPSFSSTSEGEGLLLPLWVGTPSSGS